MPTKTASSLTFSQPLDPATRRPGEPPFRPGLELSLQRELRLARAVAAASRPARPRRRWRSARPTFWQTAIRCFSKSPTFSPSINFTCTSPPGAGDPIDLFATVHRLAAPFTGFPGLPPGRQDDRRPPDPGRHGRLESPAGAEPLAQQHLRVARHHDRGRQEPELLRSRSFKVQAGEPIKLTFVNPDSVPHNWALIKPRDARSRRRSGQQDHRRARCGQPALHSPQRRRARLHRHRRAAGPVHDLLPRPDARAVSLSVHVPRALDGDEWGDDRGVGGVLRVSLHVLRLDHGVRSTIRHSSCAA